MTDNKTNTENRDEVLLAFHQAYARPTAEQIIEWVERYPLFAEDIRAHAAVAWDWSVGGESALEPDESLLASGYSRALNIVWQAANESAAHTDTAARSFQEIMAARGMTVPQLARAIDIRRGVIGELVSGRMSGPIKTIFTTAVSGVLQIARAAFDAAHRRALAEPVLGHPKADQTPTIIVRTYEEVIRGCDEMTDEEKRRWLEED